MAKPKLSLSNFTGVVAAAAGTTKNAEAEIDLDLINIEKQVRSKLGDLSDLVNSIKAMGVLEPVIVLAQDKGRYRLIAGERRLRAAKLAGLSKIPVMIKRGLSALQIRQIQVVENIDRENLSPFDEAMGVIEDVDTHGVEKTMEIWNRSDGWVSKRVAIKRYAAPVLALLQQERCGDLEVLHSLNQLYELDEGEFSQLVKRLEDGVSLSRDEVRSKVASVKAWIKEKQDLDAWAKGKRDLEAKRKEEEEKQAKNNRKKPEAQVSLPSPAQEALNVPETETAESRSVDPGTLHDGNSCTVHTHNAQAKLENDLSVLRRELFQGGITHREMLMDIRGTIADLDYSHTKSDWVLWSGFLSAVLPVIEAVGEEKGRDFVRRLQVELKKKAAKELWHTLHQASEAEVLPVIPGN